MPLFGYSNQEHPNDFRWPTHKILHEMSAEKEVRVAKIKWKNAEASGNYLGGVQVILTNGGESPVFLAKANNPQNADNMKEAVITPAIRKIKGTNPGSWFFEATFLSEDGKEVSSIKTNNSGTKEFVLAAGEEIIGVYGTKDVHGNSYFHSLGFIVWVPPKF